MNLNDLEKAGEGIPARRYADYLLLTPKELAFFMGISMNSARSYLNGSRETPGPVLAFMRTLAFTRSVMSDKEYVRLKGFLSGRITVPMIHPEEPETHEHQS